MLNEKTRRTENSFNFLQIGAGIVTTMALTFAMLTAAGAKNVVGTASVKDGAEQYGCGDICFVRYNGCMMQGLGQYYCANNYANCLNQCGAGGGAARQGDGS